MCIILSKRVFNAIWGKYGRLRGCLKMRTTCKNPKNSFLIDGEYFPANSEYQNDFSAWQFLFSKMVDLKISFEKLLSAVQGGARLSRAGEIDLSHCKVDLDLQHEFDSIPTELLEQAAGMVVLEKNLNKSGSAKILRQMKKLDTPKKNLGTEKNSVTDEKKLENFRADDLPILTATLNELEFWHACVNCHIQKFLRDYDFGSGSMAYDSFKIGVDEHNHALTFAIDDTHYLKIDLTDNNLLPIDSEQAERVLLKVNDLRFAHNKKLSRRYEEIRKLL